MLEPDVGYRLAHHEDLQWPPSATVTEVEGGPVFEEGTVRITAAPTDHAPVRPTLGYRIEDAGQSVVIAGDTVPCRAWTSSARGPAYSCTPWSGPI